MNRSKAQPGIPFKRLPWTLVAPLAKGGGRLYRKGASNP